VYEVGEGPARTAVTVEFLTATNLGSAPDYYRHMVGWNRTALRIVLPADGRGPGLRSGRPGRAEPRPQ
jgi:hypothetical protein